MSSSQNDVRGKYTNLENLDVAALLLAIESAVERIPDPTIKELNTVIELAISAMCIALGVAGEQYREAVFESLRAYAETTKNQFWKSWRQKVAIHAIESAVDDGGHDANW